MKTILIVDDSAENVYMLEFLLKSVGYKVKKANNGAQALLLGLKNPPDMIISDILMPEMDGYMLCREWMKNETLKHIPFIFYSATYTDPRDQDFGLSLGAAKFIVKPKEPAEFLKIIKESIEAHESGQVSRKNKLPKTERIYLKEYNETLVRKLQDKMVELENTNRSLKQEVKERKKAEESIRTSLEEKEVLLKEIHHRVKNNLQIIMSLLDLQTQKIKDSHLLEAFQETKNRIYFLSLVHETLYQSADLSKIASKGFLTTVIDDVCRFYNRKKRIALVVDIRESLLGIDLALPLGLIVNELVSNALKHAFPQNQGGEIAVSFHITNGETCELVIKDNGVGIPDTANDRNIESIGLELVNGLVSQINGSMEIHKEKETSGTKIIVHFPLDSAEEEAR